MSDNCVVYDEPEKMDMLEWTFDHPNCDALVLNGKKSADGYVYVKAYALNEQGNMELRLLSDQDPQYGIFVGVDKSMLSYIGGLR